MRLDVSDHFILKRLPHGLFYLLEEDLRNPATQGVDCVQELGLDGVEQRLEHVVLKGKIMYCIIDYFERWLLVIMIYSTVAMEDGHALIFSPFAVTPVHAVIWSVVPLAGEDVKTFWVVVEDNVEQVLVSPGDVVLVLLIEWMQKILPGQATGDHTVFKHCAADPCEIHQHDARVDRWM